MSGELSVFRNHNVSDVDELDRTNNDDDEEEDWGVMLAFSIERHTEKIEALENVAQNWRLKDRVRSSNLLLITRF